MFDKIQISSGVNVAVDSQDLIFLNYLKKLGKVPADKLNFADKSVIKKLLSKGIIARSKKGAHVYIQLRPGINLPENQ